MNQILNESLPETLASKDMREAAKSLSIQEVRYLVDLYYQVQDFRIQTQGEIRAMSGNGEPILFLRWSLESFSRVESRINKALDYYTDDEETGMGAWAKSICGIGPVISSGLLAHIDITKAPTVGHIWRFAGLDPTCKWEKKTKRPWNAKLKVLCWKIGESFVKVQNNPKDVYGKLYASRKLLEQSRNEAGAFAEQAKRVLEEKSFRKDAQARKYYESGKLPPAHIHARARRYAVKIFLSHWHAEAYCRHFGKEPPAPYPIAILGHAHQI